MSSLPLPPPPPPQADPALDPGASSSAGGKKKKGGAPKAKGAVRAKSGCYTCRIRRKVCLALLFLIFICANSSFSFFSVAVLSAPRFLRLFVHIPYPVETPVSILVISSIFSHIFSYPARATHLCHVSLSLSIHTHRNAMNSPIMMAIAKRVCDCAWNV